MTYDKRLMDVFFMHLYSDCFSKTSFFHRIERIRAFFSIFILNGRIEKKWRYCIFLQLIQQQARHSRNFIFHFSRRKEIRENMEESVKRNDTLFDEKFLKAGINNRAHSIPNGLN